MKSPIKLIDHQTNKLPRIQSESEKKLVELIRFKKKLASKKAKVFLSNNKSEALNGSNEVSDEEKPDYFTEHNQPQFFVQDLQRVLLYSLIGSEFRFFPRWCKILRPNHIKSVNLITINNLSEYDYKSNKKLFKKFKKIFTYRNGDLGSIDFISSFANGVSFYDEFSSVPLTRTQWFKIRDEDEYQIKRNKVVERYRELYLKSKSSKKESISASTSQLDKIPRTSLMLNAAQMIREDYPLPVDTSSSHDTANYKFTKGKYKQVTDKSPLFSIDCEMCYNIDGDMEIVWFAMVNENLECIYETYVKPRKKINNYLTHITGVSHQTLEDVHVDLSQLQEKISELLPEDGILCGQSLNNDLHALQMFHPYIIDTSVIFNVSGNRDIKPSLKQLSAQFLGKLIQESTHNPSIDAKASLELVLLKLRQGFNFGDVIVNGCVNLLDEKCSVNFEGLCDLSDPFRISKFIYQTGINIEQEFFNVIRDHNVSNIFIDREEKKNVYANLTKSCNLVFSTDNDHAFELFNASINKHKLTWSQFYVNFNSDSNEIDKDETNKLLKNVRKAYENLDDDSLMMVVLTGRSSNSESDSHATNSDFLKGRCFLKLKSNEIDLLDEQIKELYDQVNNGNKK